MNIRSCGFHKFGRAELLLGQDARQRVPTMSSSFSNSSQLIIIRPA